MAILDAKIPAWQASTKAVTPTKVEPLVLEGKAPLVIDGGALGSVRALLKNQVKPEQNGLWEVSKNEAIAGTGKLGGEGKIGVGEGWTLVRPSDADSPGDVTEGMLVPVEDGETNQATSWIQRTAGPIEVGVTAQAFEPLVAGARGNAGGDLEGLYAKPSIKEAVIDNSNVSPEAAIGASKLNLKASVAAGDLATSAKELSPQLVTPTKRKINSGTVKVTFSTSQESNTVEVAHGLEVEPSQVLLTPRGFQLANLSFYVPSRTKSSFFAFAFSGAKLNTTMEIDWLALG
jgi:hypothetical protein